MVDLRDAEVARLELLNEALDPLFAEIPPEVELFDRGLSRGETPRLWIDAVAHVAMGRDKRIYRLLQDTRVGRRVLAESHEIPEIVKAVTEYVARRLVERERALEEDPDFIGRVGRREVARERRRRRRRIFGALRVRLFPGPRHARAYRLAGGWSLLRKLLPLQFADDCRRCRAAARSSRSAKRPVRHQYERDCSRRRPRGRAARSAEPEGAPTAGMLFAGAVEPDE